jgi:hypothetical protein
VDFQFQDRISQTLEHLRDCIDLFPHVLAESTRGGPAALQPFDSAALREALRNSYTMAEEHHVHDSGEAVTVGGAEITSSRSFTWADGSHRRRLRLCPAGRRHRPAWCGTR